MNDSNENLKKVAQTVALTSLLTLPLSSPELQAQVISGKTISRAIPIKGKEISAVTIVGIDKGNAVFKNAKGEFFTVNPQTGDLEFMTAVKFGTFKVMDKQQQTTSAKPLVGIKYPPMKEGSTVTILGVNKDGQTLYKNSRGEVFYVQPTTGDFIYLPK